jgi:hypothetical protein
MFREHFLEALRVQVIFVQELQVQDSARLSFYQQQTLANPLFLCPGWAAPGD